MEVIPIISTHNNNNSSAHKEEEGNKPSEKSVETTASSVTAVDTAPSIHYYDDCDDTTLNEGHQQQVDHPIDDKGDVAQQNLHDDGDSGGADVLPGYEICISSSAASASVESSAGAATSAAANSTVVASAAATSGEDNMTIQTPHNNVMFMSNKATEFKKKKPLQKTRPDSPLPNVLRCKEQQQQLAASAKKNAKKKKEVVPLGPASHIYVLRRIVVDYVDDDDNDDEKSVQSLSILVDNNEEEDDEEDGEGGKTTCVTNVNENYGTYDDEEDDDDQIFYDAQEHFGTITIPPTNNNTNNTFPSRARIEKKKRKTTRLISTQMVQLSEEQHAKLEECSVGGTVLCVPSSWTSDDNDDDDDGCDRPLSMPSLDEGEGSNDDEELKFVDAVDEIVPEEEEEGAVNDETEVINSVGGCGYNTPPPRVVSSTDDTTGSNSSSIEDQVAVVPYCTARRRMGCNCIKGAEGDDSNKKDAHHEKKKRRRRPFKAAYQQIKRTLFYCHLNKKQSNDDTKNEGGEEEFCKECNYFGNNPPSKKGKRKKVRHPRPSPHQFRNVGAALYGNEAVINNTAEPINDILNIDPTLGIYVCESGLTSSKCQEIIDAAESLAYWKGGVWSAYTYAKQTLGCKEYDILAEASKVPVMAACATVRDRLEEMWSLANKGNNGTTSGGGGGVRETNNDVSNTAADKAEAQESAPAKEEEEPTKPPLVLDVREPHVVKYDLSRMERQKLDMHTDRSVWTFIIALSEGRGHDYAGGGTYFEKLNATIHLQRGQMIIFRGKLRHRGVKITDGKRYLLVGFLVEQKSDSKQKQERVKK